MKKVLLFILLCVCISISAYGNTALRHDVIHYLEIDELDTICEGDIFKWRGHDVWNGGLMVDTIHLQKAETVCDASGDSIKLAKGDTLVYRLFMTLLPRKYGDTLQAKVCYGDEYQWQGKTYHEEGVYNDTLTSVITGCDSIIFLKIAYIYPSASTIYKHINEGESFDWKGQTYSHSATVNDTLVNAAGCDSVVTLQLIVHPLWVYKDTAVCVGESVEWQGKVYSRDTLVEYNEVNEAGGITNYHFSLHINPILYGDTIHATVCDGEWFNFNGDVYVSDGTYPVRLASVVTGCDSICILEIRSINCHCDTMEAEVHTPFICAEADSFYIHINYSIGQPDTYIIQFDTLGKHVGMDKYEGSVRIAGDDQAVIAIPVNISAGQEYLRPDKYSFSLSITDKCKNTFEWKNNVLEVRYPEWIILQRWNDVLCLYDEAHNGGYAFSGIKWYCNNVLLESSEEGYLYQYPSLNMGADYWAELTRADDGHTMRTCSMSPTAVTDTIAMDIVLGSEVLVYPTIISLTCPELHLKAITDGEWNICAISGMQLMGGKYVYSPHGDVIVLPQESLPGVYMLTFRSEQGIQETIKFIVTP